MKNEMLPEEFMETIQLNFARKWRSRNFDQVIGQDISVRILKNSLFLNYYFPVYLFSGQRGCGKTSMARIFAAALNCEQLLRFQQDPKKYSLPCLTCNSCCAMAEGKHPDFIEIDAASYTGVDNVRQIIDTAALLPLLGRKKVYLIDEAHMLSKAAFNAFLKVLEEPPPSVLFILATTELHKIIDTVKSRSFQLFFKAVKSVDLLPYLEQVCTKEEIAYEPEGLSLIIQATEGSVRDALNLLEQVRFALPSITKANVSLVLGSLSDEIVIDFVAYMLAGDIKKMLHFMQEHKIHSFNVELLWHSILEIIHTTLLVGYGLKAISQHEERLKQIAAAYSLERINQLLKLFYTQELSFSKTRSPYNFLEMILIDFCANLNKTEQKNPLPSFDQGSTTAPLVNQAPLPPLAEKKTIELGARPQITNDIAVEQKWHIFLDSIERLNDPLLYSIFKQTNALHFDAVAGIFTLCFSKEFIFFNEWLESSIAVWKPLLQKVFGAEVHEKIIFKESESAQEPKDGLSKQNLSKQNMYKTNSTTIKKELPVMQHSQKRTDKSLVIDISDASQWKKASLIMQFFPGTLTEFKESSL